jgi:hypothetical protein
MSAYVVDPKTINAILTHVFYTRDSWLRDFVGKNYGVDPTTEDGAGRIGQSMHQLNCSAVEQRYNHPVTDEYSGFGLELRSPVAAYKALSCWLYQCYEGDVPESAEFKQWKEVKATIANEIISKTPEYEASPWG